MKYKQKHDLAYAQHLARLLKNMTGIDVFLHSRKAEVIEIRSLFIYILREVEEMTYHSIKDFFNNNGKQFDHATAMHSYKNYPMYKQYNKKLDHYFNTIVSKSKSEKSKKLQAKTIIDNLPAEVAEIFTYMIQK